MADRINTWVIFVSDDNDNEMMMIIIVRYH